MTGRATIRTGYRGFDTYEARAGDCAVIVAGDGTLSVEENHQAAAAGLARDMGLVIVGDCERDNVGRRVWHARPTAGDKEPGAAVRRD